MGYGWNGSKVVRGMTAIVVLNEARGMPPQKSLGTKRKSPGQFCAYTRFLKLLENQRRAMVHAAEPVKDALKCLQMEPSKKPIYLEEGYLAGKPSRIWRFGASKGCRISNFDLVQADQAHRSPPKSGISSLQMLLLLTSKRLDWAGSLKRKSLIIRSEHLSAMLAK